MRVAVYYRVSTDRQDFESQKEVIESWLEKNSIKPKYTIKDKKSGRDYSRKGYRELMDLAAKKKIDVIVVYKLDRFGRRAASLIKDIITLDEMGVSFIAVKTPYLDSLDQTPFRHVILSLFAEVAELEVQNLRDRINSGLAAAKKRGAKFGRPTKITEPNRKKAIKLRVKGLSIRQIAREMKFSPHTVSQLIAINS